MDGRIVKMLSDPQSLNYYAYSRNNPVNITDPSGECVWDLCIVETTAGFMAAVEVLAAATALLAGAVALDTATDQMTDTAVEAITTTLTGVASNGLITTFESTLIDSLTTTIAPQEGGSTVTTFPINDTIDTQPYDSRNIPIYGTPNTTGIKWGSNGIIQGRTYDENGNPVKDIDFSDHGFPDTHSDPHEHDWTPHEDGSYDNDSRSDPINDYSN